MSRVELPDGTVGHRDPRTGRIRPYTYQRKTNQPYRRRTGEAGQWHNGKWLPVLQFRPDEERVMPPTRPDSEADGHSLKCRCDVCRRPPIRARKDRAHAEAVIARLRS